MSTESPQPSAFEGATDIESAAEALMSLTEAEQSPSPDDPEEREEQADPAEAEEAEPEETDEQDSDEGEEPDEEQPDESEDADEADEEPEQATYKVTVQGEEREVSLDELRSGYMMHEDYSRKSRALADDRKAFYEQREQVTQATQAQLQEVGFLAHELLKQVTGEEQNLDDLRNVDPAEYSARLADINRKKEMLARAFQANQQQQQSSNQFRGDLHQQHLARERDLLLSQLPEWSDSEKATKEQAQLAEYLAANGFQPQEIQGMADHRAVILSRKAMLFDQMQKDQQRTRQEVQKKVKRPVPKVRKARAESTSVRDQRVKQARKQLQRDGSIDAAAGLLLASLEE